ncbi:hypothetical protein [Psychromonas aquimarina]|uniref:hypothetical protein n=1 Tax=Psychromonas aquimarina TaxID=444919 RepID=UPI00048CCCD7|nr:hypothetical protein [Psychromonas aquimarina]
MGIKESGTWMKPSLDERKIPVALHQDITDHLLTTLQNMQLKLEDDFNNFYVVNSFNVLEVNEWGDELHPTNDGFKKIVNSK